MIHHCVFLRFKSAVQDSEKQVIYDEIAAMREFIPGMLEVRGGPNTSSEGLNGGFLDGFIVTFEDDQVRDYYLAHPKHKDINDRIMNATDGGLSGIMVFDLES